MTGNKVTIVNKVTVIMEIKHENGDEQDLCWNTSK